MKTNKEFAKVFQEFAELLELKGEVLFKVIAYQKAAQAIADHSRELESIYKQGGVKLLKEIDGVGEGIADKIEEYIKSGKIKELDNLRKKFPAKELEFLKIPGVGPATARLLYDKFGDLTIDELAIKLSREGSKILKDKSLKKILSGIEIYRGLGDRMLLAESIELADPILKYLSQKCQAKMAEAVGSIRRRKDTIGDIDIVAQSKDPAETVKNFSKYPGFEKIISQGSAKLTGIIKSGVQVDLEILPKEKYGSLLLHFTGSKQHNVALRAYAIQKGLSLSEHGIKTQSGKLILCSRERDVYDNLGLDFIEPELREDRGEIDASINNALPKLVELKDIVGDLHIHTDYSDGLNSIEQMVKEAQLLGYEYIAITDHSVALGIAGGLDEKEFLKRNKEIDKVQQRLPNIHILKSCEVNILSDGSLDLDDKFLKQFDIITASVHGKFSQTQDEMTRRIIRAIKNPYVNIIGHPTGRILNKRPGYHADWQEIFKSAQANNVALEISAYPNRLDLPDALVYEANKLGVYFAINTDAHAKSQLHYMKYGVWVARRGWCSKQRVINCMNYQKLSKWLSQ